MSVNGYKFKGKYNIYLWKTPFSEEQMIKFELAYLNLCPGPDIYYLRQVTFSFRTMVSLSVK